MRQLKLKDNITARNSIEITKKLSNDLDNLSMTDRNIIKLNGSAKVLVRPNVIIVSLDMEEILPTNQEAYSKGKEYLNYVNEVLREQNIEESKVITNWFTVSDNTESVYKNGKYIGSKKNGFKLSQRISLYLSYDNKLINTVVNEIQKRIPIAETSFQSHLIDKIRVHKLRAMELAVKDAKEKAEVLVTALGAKLGEIVRVNYIDRESYYYERSEPVEKYLHEIGNSDNANLELSMRDKEIKEEVEIMWEVINP